MDNRQGARLAGLDVLRAVAVLLVIGRHAAPCPQQAPAGYRAVVDSWARGGWVGVDLFFVLSGFLIAGLLLREHAARGRIDYGRFLLRRGLKIYPPFWLLLAATVAMWSAAGRTPPATQLAAELFYVQNYWPGLLPHTWSLAVEEHFYLLLPLVLIACAKASARSSGSRGSFATLPQVVFWVALRTATMKMRSWRASRPVVSRSICIRFRSSNARSRK
jgi:peptidoglycan/LPS O-acetylase OafA/YrhL